MPTDFAAEWNKRLGQYIGKTISNTPESTTDIDLGVRLKRLEKERQQKLLSIALKAKASGGGGGSKVKPGPNEPVLGNLSQESVDLITDAGGNKSFMGVDMPNIWEIPGPVGKALGPIDEALIGLNIQAPLKIASTALDLISRPAYGVFNAQKQQAESYNRGEGIGQQLENLGSGFWQGFKGDEKTGYGAAVEEWTRTPEELQTGGASGDRSVGGFGQALFNSLVALGPQRVIAEELLEPGNEGTANKWAKRGLGLSGELLYDPTNLVGGKALGMMKDSAGKLVPYTDDAYKAVVKETARKGIEDAGWGPTFSRAPKLRKPGTGQAYPVGYDYVDEVTEQALENTVLPISGGATKGRVLGLKEAPYAIANNVGIGIRKHITQDFDTLYKYLIHQIRQGKMPTSAQIKQLRTNPFMSQFLDAWLARANKTRTTNSYADIEKALLDYAKGGGPKLLDHAEAAAAQAKKTIDADVLKIQNGIHERLLDEALNVPGVKVAGKTIPFKRMGQMYAGSKVRKGAAGLLQDVKYGDQFVGRTPQIAQRVRSLGMSKYEQFHRGVTNMVNGRAEVYDIATQRMKTVKTGRPLTKAERKTIHTNILNNIVPNDPRMREAQEYIQDAYKQMWQEEVEAGLRSANEVQADNYIYNYYKGSDVKNRIKKFRDESKLNIKTNGRLANTHLADAKAAGLKPEEDAFRALLYRKLKSNRQLTRKWFQGDLLDNYGIMANKLSPELAGKMKLVEKYKSEKLPDDLKRKLGVGESGDAWYLPDDINDVLKEFEDLAGGAGGPKLQGLIRLFDTWTRYFKTSATIPWPGFHIRNSIGDIFMSWIDGVRGKDIAFLKQWDLRARKNPGASIDIAGQKFTFDQMRNIFRENASSGGYQNVELIGGGSQAGLGPQAVGAAMKDIAKHPTGIGNVARRASGAREDLFRFTHFLHAMREELPKAMAKGADPERALKRAIDASTYRVNKYLFDYGALTKVEQQFFKRMMPFYTYTRKAVPTLMESLFLHPSQFAKTNRLFLDSDDGSYPDMLTPQYQREIGYARLSDEEDTENMSLLGGQFLPTDVLTRNTQFNSPVSFFQNLVSQVNPYGKLPFELAGGKQYFNDQPIDSTGGYLSDALIPPARPLSDIPFGIGDLFAKLPGIDQSSKESFMERALSGRLGAGLPYDEVNEGQQTAAVYGIQEEVQKRFDDVNGDADAGTGLQGKGYKLYISQRGDDSTFRIRRLSDNEVIYETKDAQKAMEKAKSLS